jgi:hypothetical protein
MAARYSKLMILAAAVVLAAVAMTSRSSHSHSVAAANTSHPHAKEAKTPPKPVISPPQLHLKNRAFTFPDGGRTIFPHYRLVALYGTPGEPVLGALGEQSAKASIARVKKMAKQYQPHSKQPILPTLEIITTVAAGDPTSNGDYSRELDAKKLQPWVQAAQKAGVYVVLDLQPGHADFLPQTREYKRLLAEPNVGLALDPEWKLHGDQKPLKQIGHTDAKAVNKVVSWLAGFTKRRDLPQKLLLLHQFRVDMYTHRDKIDTSLPQLTIAIQMDGQGTQAEKLSTWHAILKNPPPNVHFGWKNFYDEDHPTRSPKATMQLKPKPWYISYQ